MKKARLIAFGMSLAFLTAFPCDVTAQAAIPGAPSLQMAFEIKNGTGVVTGILKAPVNDSQRAPLPADTKMDVTVTRSCYALQESNIMVATFTNLSPGEEVPFTDTAQPEWQYGQQYTYNPVASIDGRAGASGYGSVKPGIEFSFAYGDVKAETKDNPAGGFMVELSALVPAKTNYPIEDIPVEMKAIEFYRVTDAGTWPYVTELIHKIENPEKGKRYSYTDLNPVENTENRYVVKSDSGFGFCESSVAVYVGYDVPAAPYPVTSSVVDGGVKISWTAPTTGANYGDIETDKTYYIVSRCWGNSEDQKKVIADNLKATEFIDYGTDMESPKMVRYEVTAANNIGIGKSNFSSYGFDMIAGPDETLPFIEAFVNGGEHLWYKENSSYYCQFFTASEAEFGDGMKVAPHSGDGLIYVDYANSRGDVTNDLTSYFIDAEGSRCVGLSFWYYALPSTDIKIDVQLSKDGGDFETLATVDISEDVTEAGWREKFIVLDKVGEVKNVSLRFHISAPTSKLAAVLDDIKIIDYKPVGALEVEYQPEDCAAVITWQDPSDEYSSVVGYRGYIDGVDIGDVEIPWIYKPGEYREKHNVAVQAVYSHISAPLSASVTVSVPRPPYTEFEIDQHIFSVVATDNDVHELTVKKYLGEEPFYKIPELVTYDDITYSVVGIEKDAYAANKSIVSASLTDLVKTVDDCAFKDCSELMAFSFGKTIESIGASAFKGCVSLRNVIFTGDVPPAVADDAFEGIANDCKGSCPEGTAEKYAEVEGLRPIDFGVSSIIGIYSTEAAYVEYFDMQGIAVEKPLPGQQVIIRITGTDGTVKVFKTFVAE